MFRYLHLAWGDVSHYRTRSLLTIGGVALVVVVYLVLAAAAAGMASLMSNSQGSDRNLALIEPGVIDYCQGRIPPGVARRLRRWPGVAYVAPMYHLALQLDGTMVLVRAVPPETYLEVEGIELIAGEPLADGNRVLAGEALARLKGWQVGDRLEIGGQEVEIGGLFRGNGILSTELWLTLETAERLFGRDQNYSLVVVQAEPGTDLADLRRRLESSAYFSRQTEVFTEAEVYETMNRSFSQVKEAMQVVSLLALSAIVFGIFNVVGMTVAEQTREIGILKAVGLSRAEVAGLYVAQGLVLAGLGYFLGLALGAGVVEILARSQRLAFATIPLIPRLTPTTLQLSAGLTLGLALLGAYIPAWRAAGVPVVEALREV
ncbi:MAG: ABC transporter permease [Chloroflexota bacterium]